MITAVVMVGAGEAPGEVATWVQGARRAAAADLLEMLARQSPVSRLILVSPELEGLQGLPTSDYISSPVGTIHVGETLAQITETYDVSHLLYLGGGSAPLMTEDMLQEIVQRLAAAERLAITNNQFASDWLAVTPASILGAWQQRLPRDNMLGWVLSAEAGLPLEAQSVTAASRLDIDTPLDLLALKLHGGGGQQLQRYLDKLTLPVARLEAALNVLATPASHVFIAGRLAPNVWSALNSVTRSWLRVVSEERGMVSSGRQARGEARSLLATHVEVVGMQPFFDTLSQWAEAAFIDSRVLLAHHGLWPDEASRFASDMGNLAGIEDDWLRAFTAVALEAPIPVILGGHGLMSGDMLAFCEILQKRS